MPAFRRLTSILVHQRSRPHVDYPGENNRESIYAPLGPRSRPGGPDLRELWPLAPRVNSNLMS
jgi:hypothetical protein